jgi:hypothetical protein
VFDLRDLVWVFVAGVAVGMLFEKLGVVMRARHESRGEVDGKDQK